MPLKSASAGVVIPRMDGEKDEVRKLPARSGEVEEGGEGKEGGGRKVVVLRKGQREGGWGRGRGRDQGREREAKGEKKMLRETGERCRRRRSGIIWGRRLWGDSRTQRLGWRGLGWQP